MDTDIALIVGLVLVLLSIPSMLAAFSTDRAPRASILTLLIAGGLIIYAVQTNPGGYQLAEVPDVFFNVVARIIR
ncbi:hypothetical protein DS909_21185 [Phaeobacter gallaeciensis]|uniref:50S ribosomal protein L35 n=2 Tax=Roseobacteraceae TaxID=2854170 RepID=A0A366WP85_9RHOB|nr:MULTISPECIES: hypothetical protein [Roseobacteraceae]MBT3140085.1 hypothetical protein [Falsiruegeria litorea]MBT8169155.1 hypothetical protein [Falsiruegeria litorea]RBW50379.1 hypothetical protein DS909_21185 [Phaeobacter gallaeciensis]